MIDNLIILGYLVVALALGVYAGRRIQSMRDFCLPPGGGFPVALLIGTIVATEIGGNSTVGITQKIYQYGAFYAIMIVLSCFDMIFLAFVTAKGVNQFKGLYSAGDVVRAAYNKQAQVVTGIFSALMSIATIALQLKVMGYLYAYFFGVSETNGALLACAVTILYSAYGGIRAVTFTDCLQMLMILTTLPEIAGIMIRQAGGMGTLFAKVPPSHLAIPAHLTTAELGLTIFLMLLPQLNPTVVQRLLISRNERELKSGFCIAAVIQMIFFTLIGFVGLAAYVNNPGMDPKSVFFEAINTLMPTGIRGFCIVGVLAAIMSTADSWLNASAIAISHDVIKPIMGSKLSDQHELRLARLATVLIGVLSVVMVFGMGRYKDIFDLSFLRYEIWCPAITMPLWFAIFGVRARPRAFFWGLIGGFGGYFLFKSFLSSRIPVDATLIGMLCNATAFGICRWLDQRSGQVPPPIQGPKLDGDGNLYKPSPFPKLETIRSSSEITRVF
jgi:SSS family solute:Na+ symporter